MTINYQPMHLGRNKDKPRLLDLIRRASLGLVLSAGIACTQNPSPFTSTAAATYNQYPNGGGLFVSAAFGPDGKLWRIVPEQEQMYVDVSSDFGQTFSVPTKINLEPQKIKVSGENRPGIVVDGSGRVYVLYAAESSQPVTLFYSVSEDNGQHFSEPKPIDATVADANSFQGRFALDRKDKVKVFWHDERNRTDWQQLGNAIYTATIDGNSRLSGPAEKLSETLCDCCRIAAAFDRDNQTILFTRFIYPGGVRDHGLLKIQPNREPTTWRATVDDWVIEGCPEHGPAIAISPGNRYHIAWFTQGKIRQGLFYANSDDGGQHFSRPIQLGDPKKLPSHPDILAIGETIFLAWTEFDGKQTQLVVMRSSDGGNHWQPAKAVASFAADADYPFFLSHGQDVYLSWNSKSAGYRLIPVH